MNLEELRNNIFNPTKEYIDRHSKHFAFTYANLFNFYDHDINIPTVKEYYKNIVYYQSFTKLQQGDFSAIDAVNIIREPASVNLEKPLQSQIFATYHLGSYRMLNSYLTKLGTDITLLVDEQAFLKQGQDFIDTHTKVNEYYNNGSTFNVINAEKPDSFRKIMKAIKGNSNLIIYLDGNTGGNKGTDNENLLEIPFLNDSIFCRVGVSYLSLLLKAKITPVLSYKTEEHDVNLHFFDSLELQKEDESKQDFVERTMGAIYSNFVTYLKKYPSQWEGWIYMHKWINPHKYADKCDYEITDKNVKEHVQANYENIVPFKIVKDCYFLDKNTYLSYVVSDKIHKKIEKEVIH